MCETYLVTDGRNLVFGDRRVVVDDIRQRTTLHELHHNPKFEGILLQEGVQEVDNVLVSALLHDNNLVDNKFFPGLAA